MFTELRELTAAGNWDAFSLDVSGVTATDAVGLKQLQDLTTALPRVRITAINQALELKFAMLGMTESLLKQKSLSRLRTTPRFAVSLSRTDQGTCERSR